jgi:hypothetical protein
MPGGRQIFPNYSSAQRPIAKNSALAKIKEKQVLQKAAAGSNDP